MVQLVVQEEEGQGQLSPAGSWKSEKIDCKPNHSIDIYCFPNFSMSRRQLVGVVGGTSVEGAKEHMIRLEIAVEMDCHEMSGLWGCGKYVTERLTVTIFWTCFEQGQKEKWWRARSGERYISQPAYSDYLASYGGGLSSAKQIPTSY